MEKRKTIHSKLRYNDERRMEQGEKCKGRRRDTFKRGGSDFPRVLRLGMCDEAQRGA